MGVAGWNGKRQGLGFTALAHAAHHVALHSALLAATAGSAHVSFGDDVMTSTVQEASLATSRQAAGTGLGRGSGVIASNQRSAGGKRSHRRQSQNRHCQNEFAHRSLLPDGKFPIAKLAAVNAKCQ